LALSKKDYYQILGVSRDATPEQVRAAYRALARKHHPDVNKAPDAARRFAEIQEAHEVLSDADKRRRYDLTGRAEGPGAPHAWHDTADFDLDDLGSVFDSFFRGRAPGRHAGKARRGADLRQAVSVDLHAVARGQTVRLTTPAGEQVEVRIPRGCADGAQLRVRGKGQPPPGPGGEPGDLLLTISVIPHAHFVRGKPGEPDPKSLDLFFTLPVSITEATLGATVEAMTLEGPVRLTVPPGTASGRSLRLRGRGLSGPGDGAGDLYATVRIVPPHPDELTPAERAALESLARRLRSPRAEPADRSA